MAGGPVAAIVRRLFAAQAAAANMVSGGAPIATAHAGHACSPAPVDRGSV